MMYGVYTEVQNSNGTKKPVFIINVNAGSLCAAEHVILDNYRPIDNALAFEMSNLAAYGVRLMQDAEVMELATFSRRYARMIEARRNTIDSYLDEIAATEKEMSALYAMAELLRQEVAEIEATIACEAGYLNETKAELQAYCKAVGLPAEHSSDDLQGIA